MPEWLTTGITYLLPKSEDTKEPKNYRLIILYYLFINHV
jgi:hypothetical protein